MSKGRIEQINKKKIDVENNVAWYLNNEGMDKKKSNEYSQNLF